MRTPNHRDDKDAEKTTAPLAQNVIKEFRLGGIRPLRFIKLTLSGRASGSDQGKCLISGPEIAKKASFRSLEDVLTAKNRALRAIPWKQGINRYTLHEG
jgi:hypothetical protein